MKPAACSISFSLLVAEWRVEEAVLLGGPATTVQPASDVVASDADATTFQHSKLSRTEKPVLMRAGAVLTDGTETSGVRLKRPKSMNVL
jgi:hypothetical protein